MLGDGHVRFGGRAWETDRPRGRHRAPVRPYTYVPTWSGFLYLAVVLDVWSRRVVGWAMAGHMRTELVLDAIKMAVDQRHPETVIHHSDHGSQYTSARFAAFCDKNGVQISMGSIGRIVFR